MFADWRLALKVQAAAAFVTVPLLYSEPGSQAMGSATLALDAGGRYGRAMPGCANWRLAGCAGQLSSPAMAPLCMAHWDHA